MVVAEKSGEISFHCSSSSFPRPTISNSLMADLVIVSSGHSFDRPSVEACKTLVFSPPRSDGSRPDLSSLIPILASNWPSTAGTGDRGDNRRRVWLLNDKDNVCCALGFDLQNSKLQEDCCSSVPRLQRIRIHPSLEKILTAPPVTGAQATIPL
ncbi:hypothetical protein MRB53_025832 [Persea americana]|uniref:Uncharacterized protein n=1 Tax=Persea americana TaxID=3435 RepID=A0ACC2LH04_PERAE|nr:hypothetical protein MRB53_025832 [Persea americana]